MNRLRFALLSSSVVCTMAAVACGGISDPTRSNGEGRVATISGALTGVAVPANARVALVYRKVLATQGSASNAVVEVGSDAPVINGKFTMNLAAPGAEYFSSTDGHSITTDVSGGSAPSDPQPLPDSPPSTTPGSGGGSTSGGGAAFSPQLTPQDDTVVGGQITEPLTAALAGFVVYADTNGNGKLDLVGKYADSTDQILGGNNELVLIYLKDGGALDYEKLRDSSGILPAAGFNLAWTEGKRWLPLNVVELKLSAKAQLPNTVCSSYDIYPAGPTGSSSGSSNDPVPGTVTADAGTSSGSSGGSSGTYPHDYPSPSDPTLICSADGRSFTYAPGGGCPPPPPPPVGLCAGSNYVTTGCATYTKGETILPGTPVPSGWPCPVTDDVDGGSADGGSADASFDGGSADGG
jgi:hypothetical protein